MPHASKYCYRILCKLRSLPGTFFSPWNVVPQLPKTASWRNTGQSIYWQHPGSTRADQNERLQKGFYKRAQQTELKLKRQLEGHLNEIPSRKTVNNTTNTEASRHSELWRNTHINLVILISMSLHREKQLECSPKKGFSCFKSLKMKLSSLHDAFTPKGRASFLQTPQKATEGTVCVQKKWWTLCVSDICPQNPCWSSVTAHRHIHWRPVLAKTGSDDSAA